MRYAELIEAGTARIREVGMEDYLDLGAETRSQNRINRAHMDSLAFEMRILGSQEASIETKLFGQSLRTPIVASAICQSRVLNKLGLWGAPHEYLLEIAGGIADAGSMMMTGPVDREVLAQVVALGCPVIHMIKPWRDQDRIWAELETAKEMGCVATGMDVDAMYREKVLDEVPYPDTLGHQSAESVAEYCAASELPFVIKGILSKHDALKARDMGAAGIVVSMHGGEAIDYSVPVLQILPEIRDAVPDLPILCDSGFRRGTDVLKALTLGANGVGIVTLLVVAAAADGRSGVRLMIELLNEELQRTMSLVGFPTVNQIDRTALRSVLA